MIHQETIDRLKRLSAKYMDLTGEQLFQYADKPDRTTRYVFSNRTVSSGAEAIEYAEDMVMQADAHGPAGEIVSAYGLENGVSTRVRKHDTYKHSAALLIDGRITEAMTCIEQSDAELWAHNRMKEYA